MSTPYSIGGDREIIKVRWLSTQSGSIAVVLVLLHETEQWQGYLGPILGIDEKADMVQTANWGAKLSEQETLGFFPDFTHEYTYKGGSDE